MKRVLYTMLAIAAGLGLHVECAGQDVEQQSTMVECDLLVVQIPEAAAMPLIPQLRDKKEAQRAAAAILELVAAKKATLIGWPILTIKSGQRVIFEQVEEFRYATEYKPPEKSIATERPSNAAGSSNAQGSARPEKVRTVAREVDAVPTSFETRNVGVSLEIEAVIGPDGKTIDLSLVPQHVSLLEMRRIEIEEKVSGKKVIVDQPTFVTNKVISYLSVQSGEYSFLGTFKVPKPQGFIEFFILHTQIKK